MLTVAGGILIACIVLACFRWMLALLAETEDGFAWLLLIVLVMGLIVAASTGNATGPRVTP